MVKVSALVVANWSAIVHIGLMADQMLYRPFQTSTMTTYS